MSKSPARPVIESSKSKQLPQKTDDLGPPQIYIPAGLTANTELAECQWFQDNKPMKEKFPTKSLKIISEEDEGPIEPQFS